MFSGASLSRRRLSSPSDEGVHGESVSWSVEEVVDFLQQGAIMRADKNDPHFEAGIDQRVSDACIDLSMNRYPIGLRVEDHRPEPRSCSRASGGRLGRSDRKAEVGPCPAARRAPPTRQHRRVRRSPAFAWGPGFAVNALRTERSLHGLRPGADDPQALAARPD
jgi:hypothetical protein